MKIFGYLVIDLINPVRWFKYLKYKEEVRTNVTEIPTDELQSRAELLVYRGILCTECSESGHCKCCNCPWTAKAIDPKEFCKEEKWIATTADAFEKTKEGLGIEFKVGRKEKK